MFLVLLKLFGNDAIIGMGKWIRDGWERCDIKRITNGRDVLT